MIFQVAAAEANVPEAPPVDAAPSLSAQAPLIILALLWLQVRTALNPNLLWSRSLSENHPNQWKETPAVKNLQRKSIFLLLEKSTSS